MTNGYHTLVMTVPKYIKKIFTYSATAIGGSVVGYIISNRRISKKETVGDLVYSEGEIYLALKENGLKTIENSRIIKLKVVRK